MGFCAALAIMFERATGLWVEGFRFLGVAGSGVGLRGLRLTLMPV